MEPLKTKEDGVYSVTFPLAWLKGIAVFAAKNDERAYLNGVAITRGHVVATDAHVLGTIRDDRFDGLAEIIIPSTDIATFIKVADIQAKAWTSEVMLTVDWVVEDGDIITASMTAKVYEDTSIHTTMFTPYNHPYPNVLSTLKPNHTEPHGYPCFDTAYIARFEKAARAFGEKKFYSWVTQIIPDGTGSARVLLNGAHTPSGFEGVLAPLTTPLATQSSDGRAIDDFVRLLKSRMVEKRTANWDGWYEKEKKSIWQDRSRFSTARLSHLLLDAVTTGDPVEIAVYAMMLSQRGEHVLTDGTSQDLRQAA